ncbi:aldehyde dehydrogenase family protein, partial [Pseudomonas frederiksbergensis]|nr:aldehyde dehydrogenase family protein [Pseudomonas frederiksbergensis]
RQWQPGNPLNPASRAGAIVDSRQAQRIMHYIEQAQAEGAQLVCGGRQLSFDGSSHFIEPTIFTGVTAEMTLAREEVFGPVLA